jgi:hypothetical protein
MSAKFVVREFGSSKRRNRMDLWFCPHCEKFQWFKWLFANHWKCGWCGEIIEK